MPSVEAPHGVDSTDIPAETARTPPTPAPKKPVKGKPGPEPAFFDKVRAVPKADWGTGGRACMYVYADEPITNPKTFGSTRYLVKSVKPITDLESLKEDYGSFKGWMTLNQRKTGKDQTDEPQPFSLA